MTNYIFPKFWKIRVHSWNQYQQMTSWSKYQYWYGQTKGEGTTSPAASSQVAPFPSSGWPSLPLSEPDRRVTRKALPSLRWSLWTRTNDDCVPIAKTLYLFSLKFYVYVCIDSSRFARSSTCWSFFDSVGFFKRLVSQALWSSPQYALLASWQPVAGSWGTGVRTFFGACLGWLLFDANKIKQVGSSLGYQLGGHFDMFYPITTSPHFRYGFCLGSLT